MTITLQPKLILMQELALLLGNELEIGNYVLEFVNLEYRMQK